MTTELTYLALAIILGIVHICATAAAATAVRGTRWNLSSRDHQMPPLTGKAGRLSRSLDNFKETFPLFVAAILLVSITQHRGDWSAFGAMTYVIARLLYIFLYVFNIIIVRTLIWVISIGGIIAILVQFFAQ